MSRNHLFTGADSGTSKSPVLRLLAFASALLLACSALIVTGCSATSTQNAPKEKLTVYLWSVDLLAEYAPYVESQVPNADIEWVVGNNDLDFYKFLQENNELPDIITTRRFSVNDAASLQPHLLDLSETEIAATFYTTYLDAYRNADGSVNWLPACGEVDGFIANRELFDRFGIPLPIDYASFAAVCQEFEKHGIRGFMSDFTYDYTCMEVLQGASIPQLQTLEGRMWRLDYENGIDAGLDEVVWPDVFERFEAFMVDTGLTAEDSKASYGVWRDAFVNDRVAIVRGTGVDIGTLTSHDGKDVVFLPYFGETENDNWVLTYPSFQAAVSKSVEESGTRRTAALDVLEAMFSEEGQRLIAPNHSAIPYNRNVQLELADEMDALMPYIESNHLYIRLASNEFFAASKDVVSRMLAGEYDAAEAYEAFDALLEAPAAEPATVCTLEASHPYEFDAAGGNPAASSVANTLRSLMGTEVLIMPAYACTSPLLAADYTQKALQFVIGPNSPSLFNVQMSGEELMLLARAMVEGIEGMAFAPFSPETLPVVSGIQLQVSAGENGGYVLDGVTMNGEPLDPTGTYSTTIANNVSHARPLFAAAVGSDPSRELPESAPMMRPTWTNHILEGNQPEAPTAYLTLS